MKHLKKVSKTVPSTAAIWDWPRELAQQKRAWLNGDQFNPTLSEIGDYLNKP
ncbi:MAG TPA: hypothetical protein PLM14_06055 [Candidatus Hydrogenedentes bacterium]|nr:hypothetical protein [Candidatus Hydrogenedentota bacterium]HQH52685.1 hypothetical protein [Candidatus Hydrogenedentota bacterium]